MVKCKYYKKCKKYKEDSATCNNGGMYYDDGDGLDRAAGCYRKMEEENEK